MTGLLGHATSFAARKLHLGYRKRAAPVRRRAGPQRPIMRGHEFHYASLTAAGQTRRSPR